MFKGYCFPKEVILQAVYFKLRFSLSYRDVEELLSIRGVTVDHATIQRWVYKFTPLLEQTFRTSFYLKLLTKIVNPLLSILIRAVKINKPLELTTKEQCPK